MYKVTICDKLPTLQTNDLINALAGSGVFKDFHLWSGYWQFKTDLDSVEKMAFIT